jgi:GPN-loop GTPase
MPGPESASASRPSELQSAGPRCMTPVILVVGMAGSGKTTLVNALACYLEDNSLVPVLARAERGVRAEVVPLERPAEAEHPGVGEAGGSGDNKCESAARGGDGDGGAEKVGDSGGDNGVGGDGSGDDGSGGNSDHSPDGAYVVNLDPAVAELPYEPNVDIRDTVKYKDVMREYSLGPNGAIITSLNLFATRFDQVLDLVEKRAPQSRAVVIDTPGQIETFTWSASGAIITEALSMSLPTVVLFVVDTPRCQSAMTFVSNMLYACSIMYKTRLPMVVVFNKVDVASSDFAEAWMRDFDTFDAALKEDNFAGTLARSMAQALEEFYSIMRCTSVSAATEHGMDDLMAAVAAAADEYERDYRPVVDRKRAAREHDDAARKALQLSQLQADIDSDRVGPLAARARSGTWAPHDPLQRNDDGDEGRDADSDGDSNSDMRKQLPSADWPGTGAEVGKGQRQLKEWRDQMSPAAFAQPPSTSNIGTEDDVRERERQELLAAEMQNPEDAKAYEEFVKYMQSPKTPLDYSAESGDDDPQPPTQ